MIKLVDIAEGVGFGNKMGGINHIPNPIPKDHARNDNTVRIKNYPSTPGITSNKTFKKAPKQVVHVKEYGRWEDDRSDWIDRAVKKALGLLGRYRCKNSHLSDDPVFLKNDWDCVANELYGLEYDDLNKKQQLIVRKTWDKQRKEMGLEEAKKLPFSQGVKPSDVESLPAKSFEPLEERINEIMDEFFKNAEKDYFTKKL